MTLELSLHTHQFYGLALESLQRGGVVHFRARGESMRPFIRDNDLVELAGIQDKKVRVGDVVIFKHHDDRLLVHRVVRIKHDAAATRFLLQGDAVWMPDGWVSETEIFGKVVAVSHGGTPGEQTAWKQMDAFAPRIYAWLIVLVSPFVKLLYFRLRRIWRSFVHPEGKK